MSKTTKVIAALGVVAGLGVAALPAFSYAAQTSGNVDLYVQVQPAIAMTITGNNDNDSIVTTAESGDSAHSAVDNSDPAGLTSVDGHAAATTAGTSSSAWEMLPNVVKEGGEFKSTVTVYTNSTTGYNLTVIDADSNNDLTQIVETGTPATIPATEATTFTTGTPAWGYRVGTSGDWLAMPVSTATAATIGSENTKTNNGTEYTVEYGVSTGSDQATGVYKDSIVYTATTK